MKKNQFLSALLSGLIILGIMAGCANSDTKDESKAKTSTIEAATEKDVPKNLNLKDFPIVKEPITVTLMGMKHPIQGDWSKMEFFTIMEKKTGIGFQFDTPAAEVLEEKKNLALNSGNYPEVMFATSLSREQQVKYGSQGVFVPLEGYIEKYCPNILEAFKQNPGFRESITAPDGHIYSLAQITDQHIAMVTPMWVNEKWLKKLGIAADDLPTTTDGFRDLLIRFRDEDPNGNGKKDEVPFVIFDDSNKGATLYSYMLPWFGVLNQGFYLGDDKKIHFGMAEENAKAGMQYIHDLYKEKLIDNDCFINGSTDSMAKGSEGNVGAGFHALPRFVFGNMSTEEEATYPAMPSLSSAVNPVQTSTKTTGITQGTFTLTNKCVEAGNAEAMMRWVDYLYSEEGSWFIGVGPEGHLWKKSETNPGKNVLIQPADGRNSEEVRGGEITPDCGAATPKWLRNSVESSWDDPLTQARTAWVDKNVWPYAKTTLPDMYFTSEEQSKLNVLMTDMEKYLYENCAKFIIGEESSFDKWDSFVKGLNDLGLDKMLTIYQGVYDRWAASGK